MKHSLLRIMAAVSVVLVLAFSSNPPNGRTGAPGDGLCTDCHSSSAQSGNVQITGVPSTIVPGQTYNISVISTTMTGSSLGGFQMVALHDAGNVNAGSMSNPSPASTVTPSGGRIYHEHNPAMGFGGGTTVMWDVDWTAPTSGPAGNITFYAASVLANGNGSSGGDGVVTTDESGSFTAPDPLAVTISGVSPVSCFGALDGMATANATGGSMTYNYLWSNGETNATATMLPSGMATVTVTDTDGQTATAMQMITSPDELVATASVDNQISCNGANDGQASANPIGGTGTYNYAWSDGQSTQTASGLGSGPITVTVTDSDGCTDIETVNVTEPDPLLISLVVQTNVSCEGFDDGSATVEASGGTPNYNYSWPTGQNGPTATNLAAGSYEVTVTDMNLCNNTLTVVITSPTELMGAVTATNVSCAGGMDGSASATATGGSPNYTYLWSDGQTGPTAFNLSASAYNCIVTDANGCQDMVNFNITEPMAISITLDIENESAPGAADGSIIATATGGTGSYDYTWSNGPVGAANIGLVAGDYTVTVVDDNMCEATQTGTVMGSGCNLSVDIVVVEDLDCPNGSNAILAVDASGPITSILWSTGATTDTIGGLGMGMYSVTVTDDDNCMANANITLSGDDDVLPDYILDTLCLFIDETGMAVLDSLTFFNNLRDNCDPNPSAIFSDLVVDCDDVGRLSQDYTLQDANGNTGPLTLHLIVIDTIRPVITCPDDVTINSCDGFVYDLPTASDNCDSIDISLFSGIGSGGIFPVGTTTETYQVIDRYGNRSTCSFNVTLISDLASDITVTNDATCHDSNDGSAIIAATGGTAPYMFSITPNEDPNMLPGGTYIVTIQDSSNCFVVDTFTIDAPDSLFINDVTITDATSGNFDGGIDINVVGGTMPYEFLWVKDTSMYSIEEDLENLFSGWYSVMITDDNDCTFNLDSLFVDEITSTRNDPWLANQINLFEYDQSITIQPSTLVGRYDAMIFNSTGQLLLSQEDIFGDTAIDVSNLLEGYHIVVLKTEKGLLAKSFILR